MERAAAWTALAKGAQKHLGVLLRWSARGARAFYERGQSWWHRRRVFPRGLAASSEQAQGDHAQKSI